MSFQAPCHTQKCYLFEGIIIHTVLIGLSYGPVLTITRCRPTASHFMSFNIACGGNESVQSKETAPVVRQADIRGLVIGIGTYTRTRTRALVKRNTQTGMHIHTLVCRCICTVYICTNIGTQMRAHKRWKHPHKEQDIGSSCEKWSRDDINNRTALTTQEAAAS